MSDEVRVGPRRAAPAASADVADCRRTDGNAREAAASICRIARRLPDVDFVAVFGAEDDGNVVGLAGLGAPGDAAVRGAALDGRRARALVARAAAGAWVAPTSDVLGGTPGEPEGPLVCTPLRDRGDLIGILALGSGSSCSAATIERISV